MSFLIDGYNLLHASGVIPRGLGPGGFERARNALLNLLAKSLDDEQRRRTTVVFDAASAPPGLPRTTMHHGMTVRYASDHESADALIEELIRADSAPRKLTVVSSDHRLHKAARRRKAMPVDSDIWCAGLLKSRAARGKPAAESRPETRSQAPSSAEVDYWLRQFSAPRAVEERSDDSALTDSSSIFPPGYAEDIEVDPRD